MPPPLAGQTPARSPRSSSYRLGCRPAYRTTTPCPAPCGYPSSPIHRPWEKLLVHRNLQGRRRARAPPTASPASLRGRRTPWTRQLAPNGVRPRPAGLIPTSTRPSNNTSRLATQSCCCLDNPPREFTAVACDGIGWPSSLSLWFLVHMCMRSCHPAAATGDGSGGSAAVGLAIASAAQKREGCHVPSKDRMGKAAGCIASHKRTVLQGS
nr:uncharacterized protein LOC127322151 [Lolium perenne]